MTRRLAAILCIVTLALGSHLPASSQETKDKAPAATEEPDKKSDSAAKAAKTDGKFGGSLAQRLVLFPVGLIVGTPIAIARRTAAETVVATRDLVGETENPILLGAAGVLGVPAGILSGSLQGPFYAGINSWKYGDDEPFGKDFFCLGELK